MTAAPKVRDINPRTHCCNVCQHRAWDCTCDESAECAHCRLSPEEADFVNPARCEDAPDGNHDWLSAEDRA